MGRLNYANMKKTLYYFKRNGIKKTVYAVLERLEERKKQAYCFMPVSTEVLDAQRASVAAWMNAKEQDAVVVPGDVTSPGSTGLPVFSVLVPTYRTNEVYLREMIDSLLDQTYPCWELILADATPDDSVAQIVGTYTDVRVRYHKLADNAGIAANTNCALELATGDYVGLLDHDDVLTPDALYEMAVQIRIAKESGRVLQWLYSDEDKCNGDGTEFYEPHFKEDFNLDLLLSNNYICHFTVMKRELIQDLRFRPAYDGAQDFDLVLRAAEKLMNREELIVHVPKVLYHWRCHTGSTAENPQSKMYAYDAGRRAVQDFADRAGWNATAQDTAHLGFYKLVYHGDIFEMRQDIGAIGGPVVKRGRIIGGRMDAKGNVIYKNLPVYYSGYMHRAVLHQDAEALDARNMKVRPEYQELLKNALQEKDGAVAGVEVCKQIKAQGARILYLP